VQVEFQKIPPSKGGVLYPPPLAGLFAYGFLFAVGSQNPGSRIKFVDYAYYFYFRNTKSSLIVKGNEPNQIEPVTAG
jgi:hypothetical protein